MCKVQLQNVMNPNLSCSKDCHGFNRKAAPLGQAPIVTPETKKTKTCVSVI